jgi:acetylcholinesterase
MTFLTKIIFLTSISVLGLAIFWYTSLQDVLPHSFLLWATSTTAPQVTLSQGLVIGTILDNNFPAPIEAFMGLPYAQVPIGERRFRRAVSLPDSNDTFQAKKYGPM